jgi:divalent metal cation (Fe/Co/Zn/Cd) transporter
LVSGLLGLALAAVFWFNLGNMSFLSSVFPNAVLFILAVVSGLLVLNGLFAGEPVTLDVSGAMPVILGIVLLAIWWLGIRHVGFVTTSVPLFALLALALKRQQGPLSLRDVVTAVVVACVVVGGFFWVFSEILGIRPFRAPFL